MAGVPPGWGWHALADGWARLLVADAGIEPGGLVLDLGAGTGELTGPLLEAGARVIAVELHAGRAEALRNRLTPIHGSRLTVLTLDLADLRLPRRPFRVVANPPFAGSSDLLQLLLARNSRLLAADLVLQRAVVRRYGEESPPGAGRWRRDYDVTSGRRLPRDAFHPRPKVDAAVLRIRRRGRSA